MLLAGVHTLFNLLNVLWWVPLHGLLSRFVTGVFPSPVELRSGLPRSVRALLSEAPERSRPEVEKQFRHLELLVKSIYDHATLALSETAQPTETAQAAFLKRALEEQKETLYDLLFSPGLVGLESWQQRRRQLVVRVEAYAKVASHCLSLAELLDQGVTLQGLVLTPEFRELWKSRLYSLDRLWRSILIPDGKFQASSEGEQLAHLMTKLGAAHRDYRTWVLEVAGWLETLEQELRRLAHQTFER